MCEGLHEFVCMHVCSIHRGQKGVFKTTTKTRVSRSRTRVAGCCDLPDMGPGKQILDGTRHDETHS